MLLTLHDLLATDELARCQALLQNAPWADGRIGAGSQAVQAKNNEQLPPDCDAAREIGEIVVRALNRSSQFLAACLPRKIFPPRINRYAGGTNYYGKHVDGAIRFMEGGVRVRTDISCTVFLSDPADYDGGGFTIHDAGGTRQVKLAAGSAVIYPGSHVHEVMPVTRGARMAAFFWIESMVRDETRRRLLHEFDMALTELRSTAGDSESTVALVGTYHNLLRMWADS